MIRLMKSLGLNSAKTESQYRKILKIFLLGIIAIVGTIITIFAVFVIVITIIFQSIFGSPMTFDEMQEEFYKNQDLIFIVRDYLENLEFDNATVRNTSIDSGTLSAGLEYGRVTINNPEALKAMNLLFEQGYNVIEKRNNAIYFQRWSIRNHGRGIVYSIDRNTPDETAITFLTEIEPLSKENWYFYVADFNVWRNINRN